MKEKVFKFFDIAEFCLGIAFCIALAAIAAIHETIRKLDGRGVEAQVGMHSHEDGMCIQIYLKSLRFSNRSTGES